MLEPNSLNLYSSLFLGLGNETNDSVPLCLFACQTIPSSSNIKLQKVLKQEGTALWAKIKDRHNIFSLTQPIFLSGEHQGSCVMRSKAIGEISCSISYYTRHLHAKLLDNLRLHKLSDVEESKTVTSVD